MKTKVAYLLSPLIAVMALSASAFADNVSQLTMSADLVVHPDQLMNVFTQAAQDISASPEWSWPELSFTQPYKTWWSAVQAKGPFRMTFATDALRQQQLSFELDWDSPSLSIGQFRIDDTITRNIGGINFIIHLAGQCTGMSVQIPSGHWKVKGQLAWTWSNGNMVFQWQNFQFTMDPNAVPSANLGQCQGPSGLQPALQQALDGILHNSNWMNDVLQAGVLNWIEDAVSHMQGQLLHGQVLTLKPGLDLTWQPLAMTGLAGGVVRVNGQFVLQKATAGVPFQTVVSGSYKESDLASVADSGFILPKNALAAVLGFLYRTGELSYRVSSDQVPAFVSLMQNPLAKFFVWPDLFNFAENSHFYFDITTSKAPSLTQGTILDNGGVAYLLRAPLVVHQWAPARGQYLPYVDFSAQVTGTLKAVVQQQKLTLSLSPGPMDVQAIFRSEYASVRGVNSWIATYLLGSTLQDYLSGSSYSLDLPSWPVSERLSIRIRDLQQWNESFRIPLQFASGQ